jgi:alkaline phosphatase D
LTQTNNTATFKFVVTSVPFTTLWSHDAQIDSWAGFPRERRLLLEAFHSVPNLFVLSGDRHEFAAVKFNGEDSQSYPIYEFSTSPLSMFYVPFVRTLAPRSQHNVTRKMRQELATDSGTEIVEVNEYLPKEEVIKYLPIGNFKWWVTSRYGVCECCNTFTRSDIRVDTTNASRPLLHLNTFIDGASAYK